MATAIPFQLGVPSNGVAFESGFWGSINFREGPVVSGRKLHLVFEILNKINPDLAHTK